LTRHKTRDEGATGEIRQRRAGQPHDLPKAAFGQFFVCFELGTVPRRAG
jgi:hypothetical protein